MNIGRCVYLRSRAPVKTQNMPFTRGSLSHLPTQAAIGPLPVRRDWFWPGLELRVSGTMLFALVSLLLRGLWVCRSLSTGCVSGMSTQGMDVRHSAKMCPPVAGHLG